MMKKMYLTLTFVLLCTVITAQAEMRFHLAQEKNIMTVNVKNADDLGAFDITLTYDPEKFTYKNLNPGTFLKQSQRQYTMLGPIKSPGKLNFSFFSTGHSSDKGSTGSGTVAEIVYEGNASSLKIKAVKVSDSFGNRKAARYE